MILIIFIMHIFINKYHKFETIIRILIIFNFILLLTYIIYLLFICLFVYYVHLLFIINNFFLFKDYNYI